MPIIELSQGKTTVVSDEDFEYLSQGKWCFGDGYARRDISIGEGKRRTLLMHRVIMERMLGESIPAGLQVDHINTSRCDNRRENLRLVTKSQNQMNRAGVPATSSQYKGVTWDKANRKWKSSIALNGKRTNLGRFVDEKMAALAYDAKARALFGEFAVCNFPEEDVPCEQR